MGALKFWLRVLLWIAAAILWPVAVSDPGFYAMLLALVPWIIVSIVLCAQQQIGLVYLYWFGLSTVLLIGALVSMFITAMIPYHTPLVMDWISGLFTALVLLLLLILSWSRLVRVQRIILGLLTIAAFPLLSCIIGLQFPRDGTVGKFGSTYDWYSFTTAVVVTYLTIGLQVLFLRDMLVPSSGLGQSSQISGLPTNEETIRPKSHEP